jgi:1-acyl-sn-glycerol-3-phosphate acyltransferase
MIRNLFCILVAVVWTPAIFWFAVGAMVVRRNASASMHWVQRVWSPVLLWAGGAKLEVSGLENIVKDRPYIFVSNHQSTIDIPVLFVALPIDIRFVAKKALSYVPFLGWYMKWANFVFVDRGNRQEAVASLERGAAQIRAGVSIITFPEGTRSERLDVLPFKKGAFSIAMKAGVPVIPVTIEGSGRLMPKNSWNITPGPIKVRVGKPIEVTPFGDDREGLIKAVRDVIIAQSLALGGRGGDPTAAVAAPGKEGIGRAVTVASQQEGSP